MGVRGGAEIGSRPEHVVCEGSVLQREGRGARETVIKDVCFQKENLWSIFTGSEPHIDF